MAAFDFSRCGQAKSFRRAFVCFQFWHNSLHVLISDFQLPIADLDFASLISDLNILNL